MPSTIHILGDKRTVMSCLIKPIEKLWKAALREK